MPNYLSPDQLGITPEEYAALIAVKEFLPTIENPRNTDSFIPGVMFREDQHGASKFSMGNSVAKYDCGTACCIGGWTSLYMQGLALKGNVDITPIQARKADKYVFGKKYATGIRRLFFPEKEDSDEYWDSLTPQDAVEQIELFLTTGKATW